MMKTCQVFLARLYYIIAKCTCQEVLRKNIKSKVICPRSVMERGIFLPICEFLRKPLDIVDIRYYNINTECRYSTMEVIILCQEQNFRP